MKLKKITFVGLTNYHKPYTRVRCYHFARELRRRGYTCDMCSYQDEFLPAMSGEGMLTIPERQRLFMLGKGLIQLAPDSADYLYVQKVHYHAAAPFLLRRWGRKKIILDYDDFDFDRSPMFKNALVNRLVFGSSEVPVITRRIAAMASLCVVSSHALRDIFSRYNPNTRLIPTGVDCAQFYPRPGQGSTTGCTYIWNGMIWGDVMYRNVLFLFDCLREVGKKIPGARLIIAGDGGYYDKVYQTAVREYPDITVDFRGYIAPESMPELLAESDVGLLPLIPDSGNRDWMAAKSPTKLFEYMAMGVCPVCSDFGEVRNIIRNGETGFLAKDKEQFIHYMCLLAENRELYHRIATAACSEARRCYSLTVLGGRLAESIYDISEGAK